MKSVKNIENIRKTEFGKLSKTTIDFAGEENGRWYSVDSNGRIRTHSIIVAGGVYLGGRSTHTGYIYSRTRS